MEHAMTRPRVSRLWSSSAFEGNPLVFRVWLDRPTTATTTKFAFDIPRIRDGIDTGDIIATSATNQVQLKAGLKQIIVPKGVQSFEIRLHTTKDATRETTEYFGFSVDGQSTKAAIIDGIAYDARTWWRSTEWFENMIDGKDHGWSHYWSNPAHKGTFMLAGKITDYGAYVRKALADLDDMVWERPLDAVSTALEAWLSGKVKGGYQPAGNYVFGAESITVNGKILHDGSKQVTKKNTESEIRNPNRKEVIVIGDSLSDEQLVNNGVWTRSFREELNREKPDWELWNLAHGSSASSGPDKFNARATLDNALIENPTPGLIVIAIGVNNYHNGITLGQTRADLDYLVTKSLNTGSKVILIGTYLPFKQQMIKTPDQPPRIDREVNAWSKSFNDQFDWVAEKHKADRDFAYVENFWAPLDGSTPKRPGDEWQEKSHLDLLGLRTTDGLHPQVRFEDALYRNIRPDIDRLIDLF